MAEKDLINLKDRTLEERQAIGRKGGLVKSERKALANSIKNLKSGVYATRFTKRIEELSKSPEKSAYQIYGLIERIGKNIDNFDVSLQIKIGKLLVDAHRAIHSVQQAAMVQVNMNKRTEEEQKIWLEEDRKKAKAHLEKLFGKGENNG